jgi:DNA repair protein RecN (Recombination protein N)
VLRHLRIRNFALLDDVELDLGPGLTVLTGETGAGKSLIAQAVALLRGGRASADVIRTGADEAQVEALFEAPADGPLAAELEAAGLPPGDGPGATLLVRRLLTRAGRGRVYLNGALATAGQLTELVGGLIDLAGQHEHQTLCDARTHLRLVDAFGGLEAKAGAVAAAHEALRAADAALAAASTDELARALHDHVVPE